MMSARPTAASAAATAMAKMTNMIPVSASGFAPLRGLGLVAFDLVPGAKALLARHTMGTAGRLPRLARGLDLRIAAKAAPTKTAKAAASRAGKPARAIKGSRKKTAAKAAPTK